MPRLSFRRRSWLRLNWRLALAMGVNLILWALLVRGFYVGWLR